MPRFGGGREVEARGTGVTRFDAVAPLRSRRKRRLVWLPCARRRTSSRCSAKTGLVSVIIEQVAAHDASCRAR